MIKLCLQKEHKVAAALGIQKVDIVCVALRLFPHLSNIVARVFF